MHFLSPREIMVSCLINWNAPLPWRQSRYTDRNVEFYEHRFCQSDLFTRTKNNRKPKLFLLILCLKCKSWNDPSNITLLFMCFVHIMPSAKKSKFKRYSCLHIRIAEQSSSSIIEQRCIELNWPMKMLSRSDSQFLLWDWLTNPNGQWLLPERACFI